MRQKASTVLFLLAAVALAPSAAHAAVASAAATLFEAAPFVLGASALGGIARLLHPRASTWARAVVSLFGCGCGALPGALSLPALALCWLAFGPTIAVLRCGAGLLVLRRSPHAHGRSPWEDSGVDGLTALVVPALGAAVASQLVLLSGAAPPPAVAFLVGALIGALAPCAVGSVALASALRFASPAASAGLLSTAGLFCLSGGRSLGAIRRPSRLPALAVAAACVALVALRGAGFVNPRFLPLICGAALLAAAAAAGGRRTREPGAWSAPALLIAALVLGSPPPATSGALATTLDDASPGQTLRFVGVARRDASGTTLVRFAITCCRADASPIALRLDRQLNVPDGAWIDAEGVLRNGPGGLVLSVSHARRTSPPGDPFVYR